MNGAIERDPERRCSAPGCPTVLSIYNTDHLCFAHADVASRARFERTGPPRLDHTTPYRQRIELPETAAAHEG